MNYHRLRTQTNLRRSFALTMGLTEGYEGGNLTHEPAEAYEVALAWMKERIAAGQDYLTGIFTDATLVYAWNDPAGPVGRTEPALVFSGEVSVAYLSHLSDDQVETLLDELAGRFGSALGQVRIYITYQDRAWVCQAQGKTSPRGAFSEPSPE